jgi:hypothetical protein
MSWSDSFLSSPKYGYDYVVALSQAGIDARLKQYLADLRPMPFSVAFVADKNGRATRVQDLNAFKRQVGFDPFALRHRTNPQNAKVKKLRQKRFIGGFTATPGLPENAPCVVTFDAATNGVTFNMLCSAMTVVELDPGGGYRRGLQWTRVSQDATNPWLFRAGVPLRLSAAGPQVTSAVKQQMESAVAAASDVRELDVRDLDVLDLTLDLHDARLLEPFPLIEGIEPASTMERLLRTLFARLYAKRLQEAGEPLVSRAIIKREIERSSISLTGLNYSISPFQSVPGRPAPEPPEAQARATLNLLCEADGDTPRPPVRFDWNWMEDVGDVTYHGVVAINRATFVKYVHGQLVNYVRSNCYRAGLEVGASDGAMTWELVANQEPRVTFPPVGPLVVAYAYEHQAQDGVQFERYMLMRPSFTLEVRLSRASIIVDQHLMVYVFVQEGSLRYGLGAVGDANIVDRRVVDTYEIRVDQDGRLALAADTPRVEDASQELTSEDATWSGSIPAELVADLRRTAEGLKAGQFSGLRLGLLQDFVFPGGRKLAFGRAGFSDNQDLVGEFTYV